MSRKFETEEDFPLPLRGGELFPLFHHRRSRFKSFIDFSLVKVAEVAAGCLVVRV